MKFDLDGDICDENKIEEIQLNCPWTIIVPLGASHNFMITQPRWSFQQSFWLTANFYTFDKPAHPITLDIKRKTLGSAKLFITLTVYKEYPEPHHTQHDINNLRDTGYYIQEIKKIVQNHSN